MTFASRELGPSLFLLPSKVKKTREGWNRHGIRKCGSNRTNNSRWMVEQEVGDGGEQVIWGDIDLILEVLKRRWQSCKDDHPHRTGISSCGRCAESRGNPVTYVQIRNINVQTKNGQQSEEDKAEEDDEESIDSSYEENQWNPPKLDVTIRRCYSYGSLEDITFPVFAMSGKVEDLFELLKKANFGRFTLYASPLKVFGRGFGTQQALPDEKPSTTRVKNDQAVIPESKSEKGDPLDLLVDACTDLRVIELGNDFRLYRSAAYFLHRVLSVGFDTDDGEDDGGDGDGNTNINNRPDERVDKRRQANVEHLELTYHAAYKVNVQELEESIEILADAFKRNKSLRSINLFRCGLSDTAVAKLVHGMKYNTNIEKLYLGGNGCRDETMTALGSLLSQPGCSLKILDVSHLLSSQGANDDSSSVYSDSDSDDEDDGNGGEGPESDLLDLTPMAYPGLETNHSLEHLQLVGVPQLKESGVEAMLNAIRTSIAKDDGVSTTSMTKLILRDVKRLTPKSCQLILQIPGLKHLFMKGCRLSGSALKAIGETFKSHSKDISVDYLNLGQNRFDRCSVDDMKEFSQGIAASTSLRHLDLEGSRLDDDGIVTFSQFLPSMKSLTGLNLDLNRFDVVGAKGLVNGLKQNKVLRGLGVATRLGGTLGGPPPKYVHRFLSEYESMRYYLALNRGGRILLEKGDTVPAGLWPLILGKLVAEESSLFPCPRLENGMEVGLENEAYDYYHRHDIIFCLLRGQVLVCR